MTIVKPIEIVVLQKYHTFIIESHPGCGVWQNRSDKILKCIETVICVYLFIYGFVYYAVCECDFFYYVVCEDGDWGVVGGDDDNTPISMFSTEFPFLTSDTRSSPSVHQ